MREAQLSVCRYWGFIFFWTNQRLSPSHSFQLKPDNKSNHRQSNDLRGEGADRGRWYSKLHPLLIQASSLAYPPPGEGSESGSTLIPNPTINPEHTPGAVVFPIHMERKSPRNITPSTKRRGCLPKRHKRKEKEGWV